MSEIGPGDILSLWYSERVKPLWFNSTPEFDDELREKYSALVDDALADRLSSWRDTPEGALALVILLDQFPLNMYRGKPQGFMGEAKSREIAGFAIEQGFDQELSEEQKIFLYMPFMHSEDLSDQDRAITLFAEAGLADNLKWAGHHRELIRKFGRFPHRNAILGRDSTEEEVAYLDSDEAFHG